MALKSGVSGEMIKPQGQSSHEEDCCSYERGRRARELSTTCHLGSKSETSADTESVGAFVLDFLVSKTMRINFYFCFSQITQYVVTKAQVD